MPFMQYIEKLEMLIDGAWRQGRSGDHEPVINPATEEVLGLVPHASHADLDEALAASERGFNVWRKMTAFERCDVMLRAARLLEERREEIACNLTLEMGKTLVLARGEMTAVIDIVRWYAEEGKRVYGRTIEARIPGVRQTVVKEPVGPSIAFVAWNNPGNNVIRKIAAALAAGCSIVLKPSEETPGTAIGIARCFQDAGLPAGVLNIVFGTPSEVSSYLLKSSIPRKMSFTGSTAVGKHLQRLAADNLVRCTMELGGHAPAIVFADADIEKAVDSLHPYKFRNGGQFCVAPTRFYIHETVYEAFIASFTQRTKKLKVGNGLENGVDMGPLIAGRRLQVMDDFVGDARAKGAKILTGGERLGNRGYFYAPTVLRDVPDNALIMRDEPFGPLAPMTTFSRTDELLERANALPVGLAAYVYTTNGSTATAMEEELDVGMVGINHTNIAPPETPFGGVKESGYGSEGGIEGLEAYQRIKLHTRTGV
jgi:succinate-semialdehyde dehydrogenase/glutarate-semialdehyde dehydrogenase